MRLIAVIVGRVAIAGFALVSKFQVVTLVNLFPHLSVGILAVRPSVYLVEYASVP